MIIITEVRRQMRQCIRDIKITEPVPLCARAEVEGVSMAVVGSAVERVSWPRRGFQA